MRSSYMEVLLLLWNLLSYISAAAVEIMFDRLLSGKTFELGVLLPEREGVRDRLIFSVVCWPVCTVRTADAVLLNQGVAV